MRHHYARLFFEKLSFLCSNGSQAFAADGLQRRQVHVRFRLSDLGSECRPQGVTGVGSKSGRNEQD
jgi:hypothetical protein